MLKNVLLLITNTNSPRLCNTSLYKKMFEKKSIIFYKLFKVGLNFARIKIITDPMLTQLRTVVTRENKGKYIKTTEYDVFNQCVREHVVIVIFYNQSINNICCFAHVF